MAATTHDRWLIPARQCEMPGRDLLPATALHARRESTFLLLASFVLTATIALPLFANGTVVDLGGALGLEQRAELTFGVLVFPIALLISQLVCELYGARRTYALVSAAMFAGAAIVAIAFFAGTLTPVALPLALVAFSAVAHATNALVFAGLRRAMRGRHLIGRSLLSIAVCVVIGELVFLVAMYSAGQDVTNARSFASVAALYTCVCAVAAALPLSIVRRLLAIYLRVGRTEEVAIDHAAGLPVVSRRSRLPAAVIVDDEPDAFGAEGSRRRVVRPSLQPFTNSEIAFFVEGEELSESV